MKTITLLSIIAFGLFVSSFAQNTTIELTFTAENNGQNVPLDSILIENFTQDGDTTLYAPDTVLILNYISGIRSNKVINKNNFSVSQNYPNPFNEKTTFNLYLQKKEHVIITVRDILGRELANYENILTFGNHSFTFYSGNDKYYLLTVSGDQTSKTIKMLNASNHMTNVAKCKIVYDGLVNDETNLKSKQAIKGFEFRLGDELKYTSYSNLGERTIIDWPTGSKICTFQYASYVGNPCLGMPTITDFDGNTYNTVQIDSQCWMAENLKTTTYRNGTPIPNVTSNVAWTHLTTSAYVWQSNDINWKRPYGALYNWYAIADTNGLCPAGWHVPTDNEWSTLTNFIGGTNSPHGNELKSCRQVNSPLGGVCNTSEDPRWNAFIEYGTDNYWFSGLPGGYRDSEGNFLSLREVGVWWSSSEDSSGYPVYRQLDKCFGTIYVNSTSKQYGYSVRCIKD